MANYLVTDTDLTAVADAIRTKGGTSEQLVFPSGFASAISNIPTGGGGGDFSASGTYTPEQNTSKITIDTGVTGWTHFLLVARSLPYDSAVVRCLGMRYADTVGNFELLVFGSSGGDIYPTGVVTQQLGTRTTISGTSISWSGIASQIGTLVAGVNYDWWCW